MLEEEYEKDRRRLPRHLQRQPEPERPFASRSDPSSRDVPDIRESNYYVTNSVVTFDEEIWSVRQWRRSGTALPHRDCRSSWPSRRPVRSSATRWCSRCRADRPTGSRSRTRSTWAGGHRKGLGKALLEALIEASEADRHPSDGRRHQRQGRRGLHRAPREARVRRGRPHGSGEVQFGRWLGTIYMQKALNPVKKKGLFAR